MTHLIKTFFLIAMLTLLTACSGAGETASNSGPNISVARTPGGQELSGLSIGYSIQEVENESEFNLDNATYQILVTYENNTSDDITLAFSTSSLYKDYTIVDSNDAVLVNSANMAFDTELAFITVSAGKTLNTQLGALITKTSSEQYTVSTTVRYFVDTVAFSLDISSQF